MKLRSSPESLFVMKDEKGKKIASLIKEEGGQKLGREKRRKEIKEI